MPKLSSFTARAIPWLIVGGFASSVVYLLLATTEPLWGSFTCLTIVKKKIRDISGYDFEISRTINCDVAINVLVSKVGQQKKILIFKFIPPDRETIPVITAIDHDTVRISMPRVPYVFCRKDKWDPLTIKYDIGIVDYRCGQTDEC
jgi:hypothetical protein